MLTVKQSWALNVNLSGIGVSMVDKDVKEITYALIQGLKLKYWETEIENNFNASIKWLQVDNQSHACQQPIVIYPSLVSRSGDTAATATASSSSSSSGDPNPAFFEISLFKLKDTTHGVEFFKYLGVLLQEVSIDIDEQLIRKIFDFWKFGSTMTNKSLEDKVFENLTIPEPNVIEALGLPVYFEQIELNPMKINFSFTKAEISEKRRKLQVAAPIV